MTVHTYIKKLAVPLMVAGLAVGFGSNALAVPDVPTIYDPVTGFTWGMPMSVTRTAGLTWADKKAEVEAAGYVAASLNDVLAMYQHLYGPNGSDTFFNPFLAAFGFDGITDIAYTVTPTNDLLYYSIGKFGSFKCLGLSGTFLCGSDFADVGVGFMYYKTPEPSMIGLFGGMMLSMAWIAHRRLRKD